MLMFNLSRIPISIETTTTKPYPIPLGEVAYMMRCHSAQLKTKKFQKYYLATNNRTKIEKQKSILVSETQILTRIINVRHPTRKNHKFHIPK